MSSFRGFNHRPGWLKGSWILGAAAVFAAILLAGCGSGSSSSSSTASAGKEATATESESASTVEESGEPTVSEAELQKTVNTAFLSTEVKASSLPPLVQEALELATPEPSKAEMEKAYECWTAGSCTIGNGPITLGINDTIPENMSGNFTKMGMILQAMKLPEVGKIIYANAQSELATYQANLRSLVAEGATAIAGYNAFGAAAYSAFETAQREGASIALFASASNDAPPSAVSTRIEANICDVGKEMAKATEKAIGGKGPVSYFEGTTGNSLDAGWQKCATEAGIESVFKGETEWTPAGAQKAASTLIASGKPTKAILYSYAGVVPNIVDVYLKAGKEIPAIITFGQANGTSCQWIEHPYGLYQSYTLDWEGRVAVDAAVKKAAGEEVAEAAEIPQPFEPAKKSSCDPSKPAEYEGPSTLIPEFLAEKMLAGESE